MAQNRDWVGGTPGILAVLHTWSRTMEYHPHVHLLVSAGGWSDDGAAWVRPAHPRFLCPGYVLSRIFRAKLRDALTRAGVATDIDPRVWQRRWTVHVAPIGSGEHATLYLSRYVYRVALTNDRLQRFAGGRVIFRYTHSRTHASHSLTLPVDTFLGRFLQHVLPRGFTKVRWYGLLSPGRRAAFERARALLTGSAPTPTAGPSIPTAAPATESPPESRDRCPRCARGQWVFVLRYHPHHPTRAPPACLRVA